MARPPSGYLPRPHLLIWGVDVPRNAIAECLSGVVRDAACWSAVSVVERADARISKPDLPDLDVQWLELSGSDSHIGQLVDLYIPTGVPLAWLVAGTQTSPNWVCLLQQALDAEPLLGTCSPLALGEALFDPLPSSGEGSTPAGFDLDGFNHWLQQAAAKTLLDLGRPLAQAGLMRHECWQAARSTPKAHWALATARAGWVHATCQRVCVSVAHEASLPSLSLLAHEDLWKKAHPLTGLRYRLSVTPPSEWAAPPPAKIDSASAEVRLHVTHSWGGGLAKWVREFCLTDSTIDSGRNLILKSIGTYGAFAQRLELHAHHDGGAPLEVWELGLPIHATALSHIEVKEILNEIIKKYGVSHVIVSSLIGHSLDVLRTGLPTLLVMHDHYPYCITLYAQFEEECRQCDRDKLERCVRHNPSHRFFPGISPDDWQALRDGFVDAVTRHRPALVAPSASVAQRWQSLMPELRGLSIRVVEHGLMVVKAPGYEPPTAGPLRVVMVGRLSAEKGRALLSEIAPALAGWARLLLLGCGEQIEEFKHLGHVEVIEHFDPGELGCQIANWQPHLGLLTSTVPETFSYALSELWHCHVPVLATNVGALGDRIRDGENGFLEAPTASALLRRMRLLNQRRDELSAVRTRIKNESGRGTADMVADYADILTRIPRIRPLNIDIAKLVVTPPPTSPHQKPGGWLHVNPAATWAQAAKSFWSYTREKAANSPRVPAVVRKWVKD